MEKRVVENDHIAREAVLGKDHHAPFNWSIAQCMQ